MANIRLIKGRIKSAKNIAQITKAMELVAAAKMKKAQMQATAGKLYAEKIYQMVMELGSRVQAQEHPLLKKPPLTARRQLVILISTNKGLCGGLNSGLFRFFNKSFMDNTRVDLVSVGKKGASFMSTVGVAVKADFSHLLPGVKVVPPLTELVIEEYLSGKYTEVNIVFNKFASAMKQIPSQKRLLPLTIESLPVAEKSLPVEFLLEPSAGEIFEQLLPHYVENQIRDAVLQAEASEHSARMVAMRSATDNAKGLMADLTLLYNKARQEKITYEITDMVTARLAVE